MKINYKESQIDFFVQPETAAAVPPRYMAAQVSLSLENLVILAIAAIMLVIFSFSVGLERGKRAALAAPATTAGEVTVAASAAPVVPAPQVAPAVVKAVKAPVKENLKKTPAEASPAATSGASYTLQVASYRTSLPAQREADKLKAKGFKDVHVIPKGAYMIVCVGSFGRKEDASGVKRQLKSRYQDFVVRRL
jgi:cell division septation protein DedD